jgi:trans-aconitate methyltransferase
MIIISFIYYYNYYIEAINSRKSRKVKFPFYCYHTVPRKLIKDKYFFRYHKKSCLVCRSPKNFNDMTDHVDMMLLDMQFNNYKEKNDIMALKNNVLDTIKVYNNMADHTQDKLDIVKQEYNNELMDLNKIMEELSLLLSESSL